MTNSLCTPSRASILTGTYSHVNGVYSLFTPLDAGQPTFISRLRDAGYRTAMIGKWHMGHGEGHNPEGFDYWDVVPGQGDFWDPVFIDPNGRRTVEGYATDVITDLAIDWADSLPGRRPVVHARLAQGSAPPVGTQAGAPGDVRVAAPDSRHVLG